MNANGHPKVAAGSEPWEGTWDGSHRIGRREFLSRTDLRDLGLPRRAIDVVFGNVPVVAFPGYSRPFVRRQDFDAFIAEHTFDETRVRP